MAETLAAIGEAEAAEEKRLASPAAVAERESSRQLYRDISPVQAEALLTTTFADVFASLGSDPARFLTDAKLDRVYGETAAQVTSEGTTSLMEGPVPVQAENEEGELKQVSLELEVTPEGWVPANPLVEVAVAPSADEGVEIGDEGLTITQAGTDGSMARPLGDKNLFFSEVEGAGSDTDMLVAMKSEGAEIFDMLRSPESPETLHYQVELPPGATLQQSPSGGAEILRQDGELLAEVPSPHALDAQGKTVPVELEVEGNSLMLHTSHREEEVAYPVLVDPEVRDNWYYSFYNNQELWTLGGWVYNPGNAGAWLHHGTEDTMWPGHGGLFFAAEPTTIGSGQWAQYAFGVPNASTYIEKANLVPYWFKDQTTSSYSEPYDYAGMWYGSSWVTGGPSNWTTVSAPAHDLAKKYGVAELGFGQAVIFGMGTTNGQFLGTWRNVGMMGAQIWWNDWGSPELSPVTGMPSGWVKMDGTSRTVSVSASDAGLGVQKIRLIGVGGREYSWNQSSCAGTYGDRCANSRSGSLTFDLSGSAVYEGEQTLSVQALDPVGHGSNSRQYPVKLDGLAPLITLDGQLAQVTQEQGTKELPQAEGEDRLSLPVYNLKLKAEDLLGAGPSVGSGVKELKIFLDGKALATQPASCGANSCPSKLEWTYPLALTGLSEKSHVLEVRARDFVGNETEVEKRKIEFEYVPATGMKEEYVLQHFVLPDGHSYEGEDYEGPELAVNVTNGNVVYRERDLQVQAASGNLELERIYNSQQPVATDGQWGHGWTLAQTPEFKPEAAEGGAKTARMLRTSTVTKPVSLPETTSQEIFNNKLHATIDKLGSGGYELTSASEESSAVFDPNGHIEEERLSSVSPEATEQPKPVFPVFAEALGSAGNGNGQLSHPADAARDSKGNLWVVDKGNNRIVEFNEAGEFVRSVGAFGVGAGQLNSPSGIALDSFGALDVTDTGNNRIVRFGEAGEFLSAVGANVNKTKVEAGGSLAEKNRCTASSGNVCQAGTAGTAEGLMSEPIGITTSGGGNFFVVEKANNRVEKFNTNGELLAKFGSTGSEPGKLSEPTAIATSSIGGGYLWVADTGNNRIEEWTSSFSFVRAVGKQGSGTGVEFKRPAAIEADSQGNVWVGDQGNDRIQELSPSGDFITQTGSEAQFDFSSPMGIFIAGSEELWITDSERGQVQKWFTGASLLAGSRIGSLGSGNGQFNHPADVAVDSKGNIWALDRGNSRIEKFNEKGEFLLSAGASGTGAGKLSAPAGLAVDSAGNAWVADTANNRIAEFNEKGEFVLTFGREVNKTKVETAGATESEKNLCTAASGSVCQAGAAGTATGQLKSPQGIAVTSGGNLWVADTANGRIQKFGPTGAPINLVNGNGTSGGPLKEPSAIAMGPDGSIWVADTGNNRIEQWSAALSLTQVFGSEGTGNGQFGRPAAIDVDSSGAVWVGDQNNQRVQEFTSSGGYVAQLGSRGLFSFSSPMGLACDGKGGVWIANTDRNRIERIPGTQFERPLVTEIPSVEFSYSSGNLSEMELDEPGTPEDPAMTVSTTSGLTASVSSEAGTASYSYASGNLTGAKDPQGETTFQRDASNRITEVKLPNGTSAKVVYDSIGRATEVTVKPSGGVEQTTHFSYQLEPRKTTVWGGGNPETIFYIGEDGSVIKSMSAVTPPSFPLITGSLWGHKNDPNPLENKDQTLFVTAESQNEIASIKIVADGAVLAETTCEDKSQPPAHNCDRPAPLEWITNPSEHAAGRLDLEVIATDFLGHSLAERFFVVIPPQPPPNPEEQEPPDFAATKEFREDYGLDRAHPLSQSEMNRLVLELLYEWEAQLPTAVAAVSNWGVPMRSAELAEMEYRREYTNRAADVIPEWAEEHASSSYGGFYVDDRAGGLIRVGFTENQQSLVESLKQDPRIINAGALSGFPVPPTKSLQSLETTIPAVESALTSENALQYMTSVRVASTGNSLVVGATNTQAVTKAIQNQLGSSAPVVVVNGSPFISFESRYAASGPVVGGAAIGGANGNACTAGFGARRGTEEPIQGREQYLYFVLTAGHCYPNGMVVARLTSRAGGVVPIGYMKRNGLLGKPAVDGGGVLIDKSLRSHSVLNGDPLEAQSIQGHQRPKVGRQVCWSGKQGGNHCGRIRSYTTINDGGSKQVVFVADGVTISGDSGGPVWDPETHRGVGLIKGSSPDFAHCEQRNGRVRCDMMAFTPLQPAVSPGIEATLDVEVLKEE